MPRNASATCSHGPATFIVAALLWWGVVPAHAAEPFTAATVTRLQNKVSYGDQRGADSVTRPAEVRDVIRARNFLLTEKDARAELQYFDGSIVRVGQNTVFTFEADSRTLSLTKGSFIFYVPKGNGGIIRTPSIAAAITGTVGKVSRDTIALVDGSMKLIPSGRVVSAGQFARRNADGSITIDFYDASKMFDGRLMSFNGPLPPFRDREVGGALTPDLGALTLQETLDRTANHPSANRNFFPVKVQRPRKQKEEPAVFVPPPTPRPTPTPPPRRPPQGSP